MRPERGSGKGGEGRCGAGRTAQLPEERHDLLLEDVVDVRAALRARVARQPGQPQLLLLPKLPQLALAPQLQTTILLFSHAAVVEDAPGG